MRNIGSAAPTFGHPALERLRRLAAEQRQLPLLERLIALSRSQTDARFVGAIAAFIATPEILEILATSGAENRHAEALDSLGRVLWAEQLLVDELRPFSAARVAGRELRDFRARRYLPVLLAARRPLPSDELTSWIQRLRVFLVVRAIEALESGFPLELNLLTVSRFLLPVCDQTGHEGRKLLQPLVSLHQSMSDLAAEALLSCRQPEVRRKRPSLFRALANVITADKWSFPSHVSDPDAVVHQFVEYLRPATVAPPVEWPGPSEGEPPRTPVDLGAGTGALIDDGRVLPGLQRAHDDRLRLRHVEHSLFLRHTWHHLRPEEEAAMFERISELLHEGQPLKARVGAAITLIAVLTAHTMTEVQSLRLVTGVETEPGDGWTLNLRVGRLERRPPRMGRRWQADEPALKNGWVHTLEKHWSLQLDARVMAPVRAARQRLVPGPQRVVELWQVVSADETLPEWFAQAIADNGLLQRLTGPGTAFVTGVHAFQRHQDHVFARLVASSPGSALPGACAYSAYSASEARDALNRADGHPLWSVVRPEERADVNAGGSELDLLAVRVRPVLHDLSHRIGAAAESGRDWVRYHNLLCAQTVLALLACTGGRPVASPFESLAWFDFERNLVYVEDKATGPTKGSRLCILSEGAADLLRRHYLPHLERLAAAIRPVSTELADSIAAQLARHPEAGVPLFFFVRDEPRLSWIEVTETQLGAVAGIDWPLPWNLFRHFLATGLRRLGLHPDIRDALLGHADREAEAHGYHSFRVPLEDLNAARPLVNRLQVDLGFSLPIRAGTTPVLKTKVVDRSLQGRSFGREARRARRDQTHESARRLARRQIEELLGGRDIGALSPSDLDEIARRMLFRDDNVPHVLGSLRYAVFEHTVLLAWQHRGSLAKRRRRFVPLRAGQPLFKDSVIEADRMLAAASFEFDRIVATLDSANLGQTLAAAAAAIDLILHSRVAHCPLIRALTMGEGGFRRLRLGGCHWLDWALGDDRASARPVFRVGISRRALGWVAQCDRPARQRVRTPALPMALTPLAGLLDLKGTDLDALLMRFVELQQQSNALHLPGVLAGYLCGERASSALPIDDALRMTRRGVLLREEGRAEEDDETNIDVASARKVASEAAASDRCAALFADVRKHLASTASRADTAAAIRRRVRGSGFSGGAAPHLLVLFALHLLEARRHRRRSRQKLVESTVLRYWDSLARRFRELASECDLTLLDADELTELYIEIVEFDAPETPSEPAADADEGPSDRASRGSQRALDRLREFHEYASRNYGIAEPDWSELALDGPLMSGRPGIVLVREHLAAIDARLADSEVANCDSNAVNSAFVMVVCARYGLRLREAAGLFRRDLVDVEGGVPVILVQSNAVRGVKSDRSKRHIPLLEALSAKEGEVIAEVLRRWEHREGRNPDTPLLDFAQRSFPAFLSELGEDVRRLLKRVTGRPDATIHLLRHGYAMRALSSLYGTSLGEEVANDPARTAHVRRTLLGHDVVDRRLLWAVSRLLGHASPRVTLYSYVNCLYAWLPHPEARAATIPGVVEDLDDAALDSRYLEDIGRSPSTSVMRESTLSRLLRYARLLAIGQAEHVAARRCLLAEAVARDFDRRLMRAAERLAEDPLRTGVFRLLGGVRAERLVQLAEHLRALQMAPVSAAAYEMEAWVSTIGRSRQIVLCDEAGIDLFSIFLRQLRLAPTDVWLMKPRRLHASLVARLDSQLGGFVHEAAELGPTFQLDAARLVLNGRTVEAPDRVVAVPAPSGYRPRDTFELMILWIAYAAASASGSTGGSNGSPS